MQYIEIDFNTIEVHIDLASSVDPLDYINGCLAPGQDLDYAIQDAVLTALGETLTRIIGVDLTVRVKVPPVPVVPLVAQIVTVPF